MEAGLDVEPVGVDSEEDRRVYVNDQHCTAALKEIREIREAGELIDCTLKVYKWVKTTFLSMWFHWLKSV